METTIDEHKMIGQRLAWGDVEGVCDKVQTRPANYVNLETGEQTCDSAIRFRLRPDEGRARWTEWFPDRDESEAGDE